MKDATKNPNPSVALKYLRTVAKSYVAFVPGASIYVDKVFDEFDEVHKEHGEEMDVILKEMTKKMYETAKEGKPDAQTAVKVFGILGEGISELRKLGNKAGQSFLDKNPQLAKDLGNGYQQMKSLADKAGPEGKKILDEVTGKVRPLACAHVVLD